MAESFILKEVVTDLVKSKASLVDPLMKLQYFASLTKNEELLHFVLSELRGYKTEDLPDYRKPFARINVDIQFGTERHNGFEIPKEMFDVELREQLSHFPLKQSVSVLESMERETTGGEDKPIINWPFPMTMWRLFQVPAAKLYKNPYYKTEVVGARLETSQNILPTALTSIRSRLLSFCMEISETFGDTIEIDSFNKLQSSNNKTINNFMNTTINNQGDGSVVNTGKNANIHANITISKGNIQELTKKLEDLGIDAEDIGELHSIIEKETPDPKNKKLGNKTIDWITKTSGKALKGIGSVAKEVTSALLANLIGQYLGLSPWK